MNHRIVSAVIGLVLLLFAGSAVLFGLGMAPHPAAQTPAGTPPVPHETTGAYANCRDCHVPGGAGAGPAADPPVVPRPYLRQLPRCRRVTRPRRRRRSGLGHQDRLPLPDS